MQRHNYSAKKKTVPFVKEQRQRDHALAELANEVAECPKIEQGTIVSLVPFNSVVRFRGTERMLSRDDEP